MLVGTTTSIIASGHDPCDENACQTVFVTPPSYTTISHLLARHIKQTSLVTDSAPNIVMRMVPFASESLTPFIGPNQWQL